MFVLITSFAVLALKLLVSQFFLHRLFSTVWDYATAAPYIHMFATRISFFLLNTSIMKPLPHLIPPHVRQIECCSAPQAAFPPTVSFPFIFERAPSVCRAPSSKILIQGNRCARSLSA
jgi:hypothetical protein